MSLAIYIALVCVVVAVMLGTCFLGQRHKEHATKAPYESGIVTTGNARIKFPAHFYLIGMFFVLFDLETLYLVIWAAAAKELAWVGYIQVVIFVVVLTVALIYLWRTNGLNAAPPLRKAGASKIAKGEQHA